MTGENPVGPKLRQCRLVKRGHQDDAEPRSITWWCTWRCQEDPQVLGVKGYWCSASCFTVHKRPRNKSDQWHLGLLLQAVPRRAPEDPQKVT